MIGNIIHTLGSRFLISLLNLVLLFITTKIMGAEVKGAISLLVLNLSIAAIFSGLFGGPSLVYLVPRFLLRNILILNYAWSILSSLAIAALVYFGLIPSALSWFSMFLLAVMECLIAANLMVLLGRQRVKTHNIIQFFKIACTVGLLVFFAATGADLAFDHFVKAYAAGLALCLLISWLALFYKPSFTGKKESGFLKTAKQSLRYGSLVQVGNTAQLLNYRFSFYLIELFTAPMELALIRIGIYSAALQVAEALWQFARSVSTVQYAKVSNMSDKTLGLVISLQLGKLNYAVTAMGVAVLFLIPESIYAWAFGAEFVGIKTHIYVLSAGIIALSLSNAFSHYFAGVGQHRFNTQSSVFGLILTIAIGYPSVNYFGTLGAASTASVVYISQTIYQYLMLRSTAHTTLKDLIISKQDVGFAWQKVLGYLNTFKSNKG